MSQTGSKRSLCLPSRGSGLKNSRESGNRLLWLQLCSPAEVWASVRNPNCQRLLVPHFSEKGLDKLIFRIPWNVWLWRGRLLSSWWDAFTVLRKIVFWGFLLSVLKQGAGVEKPLLVSNLYSYSHMCVQRPFPKELILTFMYPWRGMSLP